MNLADNLRVLLKRNGLNQGDLAEITGKSRSTAGAYVRGDAMPPADILVSIASYFGVSLDHLVLADLRNGRDYRQPVSSAQVVSEKPVSYSSDLKQEVDAMKLELKMLQQQMVTLDKLASTQSVLIEHLESKLATKK